MRDARDEDLDDEEDEVEEIENFDDEFGEKDCSPDKTAQESY